MKRSLAALVFGNGAYPGGSALRNPTNDATDIAAKLHSYGFDVIVACDTTRLDMDKKLREFGAALDTHEVGLFFFAGHGMQIEGVNYLLAIDTDTTSELDAKHSSLSLDKVIDTMSKSQALTKIVILDACRDNPWERAWRRGPGTRGLASVYAPKGTIIGFATSPGETAADGTGRNGTYTSALLQHIDSEDCSIEMMFKRVRNTVAADTRGRQTTWEHTSLSGEFYFNLGLGKLIPEYKETSLADSLFVIDESRKSHKIIKALKSHNWYVQNPGLQMLDADAAEKMNKDNLFVIGRNIYQAACGSATTAQNFIANFMSQTGAYQKEKRKAILDGMLFEIFFSSKAELREHIKFRYFEEVFELQRHAEVQDSFDFIAEALTAANGNYYCLPGKNHTLAVTVATKLAGDDLRVESVYVDGADVLHPNADDLDFIDEEPRYTAMSRNEISLLLSEEMIVPLRLLSVSYTPGAAASANEVLFPRSWSVTKV